MNNTLKYINQCRKAKEINGIPTQDELQDMINADSLSFLTHSFNMFWQKKVYAGYHYSDDEQFDSIKQLWLAYVMYKKFNKVWDGTEWLKYYKINSLFFNMGKICKTVFNTI